MEIADNITDKNNSNNGGETEENTRTKHKGKHKKDKPWDNENIDHWKIEKFDPSWNESGMLEVSSFSTLFPQYRGCIQFLDFISVFLVILISSRIYLIYSLFFPEFYICLQFCNARSEFYGGGGYYCFTGNVKCTILAVCSNCILMLSDLSKNFVRM